jgi:hypothetical protein
MTEEKSGMSGYENNMALVLAEEPKEFDEKAYAKIMKSFEEVGVTPESVKLRPEYMDQYARIRDLELELDRKSAELSAAPLSPFEYEKREQNTSCELSERVAENQRQAFFRMIKKKQEEDILRAAPLRVLIEELARRKDLVNTVQILPDEEVTIMKRPIGARCWKTIVEQTGCLTVLYTED